ncbi:hypothetical protein NTJ16_003382 [Yersinia ruckeri]|nr:hypothetical protein [Yersinia ruckeri]
MKKATVIIAFSMLFFILAFYAWDYYFHADKNHDSGNEHIDLKIKGFIFSLDHFVTNKEGGAVLSEHESGFHIQSFSGEHYLFPLSSVREFSDADLSGSFIPIGITSVCLYPLERSKHNIVAFFDIDRGITKIDGNTVHLSSLFLGKYGTRVYHRIVANN